MADKKSLKLTDSELEILRVLWQQGVSTVRQVHDELAKTKDVGYTTTLKLMQIMHEKGLVSRDTSNKTHVYRPEVDQQQTRQHMVNKLIDHMFAGSASRLVMQALGNHPTSKDEIDAIKRYLDGLENKK
ncbi:BlaI/MecI/CopY family transcriptional regulator [Parapedobacter indicus]|uniref:Predicted transcriptional regulator n=1 Tax=Parapedobacter indicus TaxID=1477437 RepID=A0A1I3D7B0_9SPHI|nr:BlaI/MecI/CopY family transcriptional regulator [Parapedobacter indicus]PPL04556.1 putative transcriptional regulator [Parapedobacter indicus]SFH82640.1 Predicted transcriptional regulator [Parapedobacter indicus]